MVASRMFQTELNLVRRKYMGKTSQDELPETTNIYCKHVVASPEAPRLSGIVSSTNNTMGSSVLSHETHSRSMETTRRSSGGDHEILAHSVSKSDSDDGTVFYG